MIYPFHGTEGRLFQINWEILNDRFGGSNGDFLSSAPNPEDPSLWLALKGKWWWWHEPPTDADVGVISVSNWQWLNGNLSALLDQMLDHCRDRWFNILMIYSSLLPVYSKVARFYGLEVIQTLTGLNGSEMSWKVEQSGKQFISVLKKAMVTPETTLEIRSLGSHVLVVFGASLKAEKPKFYHGIHLSLLPSAT